MKDLLPRFVVQELELDVLPLLVLVHLLHRLVTAPVMLSLNVEFLLVLLELLQAALPVVLSVLGLSSLQNVILILSIPMATSVYSLSLK